MKKYINKQVHIHIALCGKLPTKSIILECTGQTNSKLYIKIYIYIYIINIY